MKRAIVFLATAVIATGCHTCPPTDAVVFWTFVDASGNQFVGCPGSGVSFVRVFLNGEAQTDEFGNTDFSCTVFSDGAVLPNFRGGTYALQLEGYDANSQLLYLDQRNVTLANCGETVVDASLAAVQGSLTLDLAGFTQCPLDSFVWYSLVDVTNNQIYSVVDGLDTPTAIPCTGSVLFDKVPFGQYQFDFVQVVRRTGDPVTPYLAAFQNCTPQAFNHLGDDAVTATLVPALASCP